MHLITYHAYLYSGERRKDRICSLTQYNRVFDRLNNIPAGVDHLIIQLGIPIAYPRMVFLESALENKYNPLVLLGRSGSLGLSGFVNKFNAEAELLDDLVSSFLWFFSPVVNNVFGFKNDHWTARHHKVPQFPVVSFIECRYPISQKERNWLVEQLQNLARVKRIRVSFISGDVHCAAVGCFQTLKVKGTPDTPPSDDFRYMVNIVTS